MTERKPPEKTKSPAQVAASCDGISIACETKGAGWPALVFVHGWSCDRTYWDAQVQAFSRLQCPMRLIDCAQFYAEHDDHHLLRIRFLRGLFAPSAAG